MMTAKEIIERYETTNEFTSSEIHQIIWGKIPGMKTIKEIIIDEAGRWENVKGTIIKIENRYFEVFWLEGKTEMQENDYSYDTSISEVYKKRVVTEKYLTKEEIECGGYEFV